MNTCATPGASRLESTIAQHFHWVGMRKTIERHCRTCDTCQRTKRGTDAPRGHAPEKLAEATPWETSCVDLMGPYKIPLKQKKKGKEVVLQLWAVTMIDPCTGWFEIASIPSKSADIVSNAVERTWFCRYPWPQQVTIDRGKEFLAEFATMVDKDCGATRNPITACNPRANSIVERVHQTIGNMIRTFSVQNETDLDLDHPWEGILNAIAFAVRATVHTTLQASPSQLVFGRDAILPIMFQADWKYILDRKQRIIRKNNMRENSKRTPHTYAPRDLVLIEEPQNRKCGTDAFTGPGEIVSVEESNGTVEIQVGNAIDTHNIRNIEPHHQR